MRPRVRGAAAAVRRPIFCHPGPALVLAGFPGAGFHSASCVISTAAVRRRLILPRAPRFLRTPRHPRTLLLPLRLRPWAEVVRLVTQAVHFPQPVRAWG